MTVFSTTDVHVRGDATASVTGAMTVVDVPDRTRMADLLLVGTYLREGAARALLPGHVPPELVARLTATRDRGKKRRDCGTAVSDHPGTSAIAGEANGDDGHEGSPPFFPACSTIALYDRSAEYVSEFAPDSVTVDSAERGDDPVSAAAAHLCRTRERVEAQLDDTNDVLRTPASFVDAVITQARARWVSMSFPCGHECSTPHCRHWSSYNPHVRSMSKKVPRSLRRLW